MDAFVRGVQGGLTMSEQRLIDANALLKRLKEIHYMDGIKMRLEVEYAPTIDPVQHGKWISVKDRLPERTGDYLIFYSREICRPEMAVAFFSAEDAEDCPSDTNYGFEYTTYGDHKDVLYWMPLPEMPMEENDKE